MSNQADLIAADPDRRARIWAGISRRLDLALATRDWTPAEQAGNRRHVAEALLAGRYAAGTGQLSRNGCHCWGGVTCRVLCELYPDLITVEADPVRSDRLMFNGETHLLPAAAVDALGLADAWGGYGHHGPDGTLDESLMRDNDLGEPFPAIAAKLLDPPAGLLARIGGRS